MRFRNYVNSYTRRNKIYSDEDLLQMTLEKLFDNEPEIMAQDSSIGIPSYEELVNSPNAQWIEPFTNKEGNQDGGYWQSILQPEYQESFAGNIKQPDFYSGISGNIPVNRTKNIIGSPIYMNDSGKAIQEENPLLLTGNVEENVYKEPEEAAPVLEGGVEKNIELPKTPEMYYENSQNKQRKEKYEGLRPWVAIQKAASKVAEDALVENEYYRNSLKMKDGEPLTDKFLEENDIYSLKDITDPEQSKYYREQLAKMYGVDMNDPDIDNKLKDKKIVMPKESSRLSQYAKNSEAMEKWIVENYDKIKNGESLSDDSIVFPPSILKNEGRALYTTIHNANMRNVKVSSDGSIKGSIDDPYNYEKWNLKNYKDMKNLNDAWEIFKHNVATRINNHAYEQQENNQLEDSYLSMPFNYTEEEIKKLKKKYRKL